MVTIAWPVLEYKRGEILLIVRIDVKKGYLLVFVQTLNFLTTRYCHAIGKFIFLDKEVSETVI